MRPGTAVHYNGNEGDNVVAIVTKNHGGGNVDLAILGEQYGVHKDVPRRAADSPDGTGHTWHPIVA